MKRSTRLVGLAMLAVVCVTANGRAAVEEKQRQLVGLAGEVRAGTSDYRDLRAALADGYESTGSCVSGPERGAMGVHFANGTLIGDGLLDPRRPELLIYEARGGRMRLVGVEFLVLADAWHAHTEAPPVLMGQQFHLVGSPNRYGLPAFYELHVWAWRDNPNGMFVDWNPAVSCDEYMPEGAAGGASHH
jgi:hypothetical protein